MSIVTGIILVSSGIPTRAYQGIIYTTREKVFDLGPIQMSTEERHTLDALDKMTKI